MPYTIICTCCYIAQMCALIITNAVYCWMHCMYENKKTTTFSRVCKNRMYIRRAHFILSCFSSSFFSAVHFIFYLSHLLLWNFLHSVWNFHFSPLLHVQKKTLVKWIERCTKTVFFGVCIYSLFLFHIRH